MRSRQDLPKKLSTLTAEEKTTAAKARQTDSPQLIHLVRGDLDWIVMQCLAKDRQQRYDSAEKLALDVQSHLENEPILAGPPGFAYILQNFTRRNKRALSVVGAAAGFAARGVGGIDKNAPARPRTNSLIAQRIYPGGKYQLPMTGQAIESSVRKCRRIMNMRNQPTSATPIPDPAAWKAIVLKYQKPSTWRAVWQIIDTIIPIAALWYLIFVSLLVSWWLVVPLAMLMGALLVRVFIIFHDCGHGSFFKSRIANDMVGFITRFMP